MMCSILQLMLGLSGLTIAFTMAQQEVLYESGNKFAMDLYHKIKETENTNLICSPLSLQIALAMVYAGADGNTLKEMKKVMHFPEDVQKTLEAHQSLITTLQDPVLKIASKVFIENTFSIKGDYQNSLVKYFSSEVEKVPFSTDPASSSSTINTWVENKTNNKIKDLVKPDDIEPLTKLILVNAIHFKAKWKDEFNPKLTMDGTFHLTKDSTTQVKMMHKSAHFNYGEFPELKARALEIPYDGEKFKMVIILPDEIDGLKDVEARLEKTDFKTILSKLSSTKVDLALPRFKIEKTLNLGNILQDMGMKELFGNGANLSKMAEEALQVSKVIQKAFIEVNEEGTEAAAATAFSVVPLSYPMRPRMSKSFDADHPFLFILFEKSVKMNLFSGAMLKP